MTCIDINEPRCFRCLSKNDECMCGSNQKLNALTEMVKKQWEINYKAIRGLADRIAKLEEISGRLETIESFMSEHDDHCRAIDAIEARLRKYDAVMGKVVDEGSPLAFAKLQNTRALRMIDFNELQEIAKLLDEQRNILFRLMNKTQY